MSQQNLFSRGVNKGLDSVAAIMAALLGQAIGRPTMPTLVVPARWMQSAQVHRSAGGRAHRQWRKRRASGRA